MQRPTARINNIQGLNYPGGQQKLAIIIQSQQKKLYGIQVV